MKLLKPFGAGLAMTIMLIVGMLSVGSFWTFFNAMQQGDVTGALIQFITFAFLVLILGVLITSTWYKNKLRKP